MSRENEDETADALRRLADGHDDSPHDDSSPSDAIIPMEAPQNASQPKRPSRPAAPSSSKPASASKPPPARPARPSRPEAPQAPSDVDAESIPKTPTPIPEEPEFVADDDDDTVVAPAPEPAVFVPKKTTTTRGPSLDFRRTLIPILLTFGIALPAIGIWWFTLDDDSPLRVIGLLFPITMLVLGAVLLALAGLNMAQVRRLMQQRR
ncbi:MAG TPA: hypothetical protein VL282_12360 [Tepidisphaeraceae bacterium]|jgi:hypothetical protein|nr:hypothetical protein [Tepidisphaeraceae bacterium]